MDANECPLWAEGIPVPAGMSTLIQLSCLNSQLDDVYDDSTMISLNEMKRNSEQLVECTVKIEQMLTQLISTES